MTPTLAVKRDAQVLVQEATSLLLYAVGALEAEDAAMDVGGWSAANVDRARKDIGSALNKLTEAVCYMQPKKGALGE